MPATSVRTRDPEAKRERLLEAALAEFAEHGIAGARVDRIAHRAGISPGLVYSFYEGKVQLFDAIFDRIVELTVSAVPIDADHLPEYAASLHEAALEHPDVTRFIAWYQLERGNSSQRVAAAASMQQKVAAIEAAQQRGTVSDAIPASELLALVLAVANMFSQPGEDLLTLVPESRRREVISDAVARLVEPQPR